MYKVLFLKKMKVQLHHNMLNVNLFSDVQTSQVVIKVMKHDFWVTLSMLGVG